MASSALFSTTAAKVFASVVLVGGAASVAGLGTFGSFTSTTSASEQVSSGKVELTLGTPAQGTPVVASGLVPGDTVQRAITLNRASDGEKFGSVTMTTTATANPATVLTADTINGLQLKVDQCSAAWVKSATTSELTCGGTTTPAVVAGPVLGSNVALNGVTTTLNGSTPTAFLRVTLVLPESAGNAFQGKSDTINFSFTATQRAGDFR